MRRLHIPAVLALLTLGAGCSLTQPIAVPKIAEPISQTNVQTAVGQRGGFGTLPAVASPVLRPGTSGSVRVTATLPTVPDTMSVLRVKSGRLNAAELRNLAGAIEIPNGMLGSAPTSQDLVVEWKDENGIRWTYHGSERRMDFVDETRPLTTLTVSEWPQIQTVMTAAQVFMDTHGLIKTKYGPAYIDPDWSTWWDVQQKQGKCMGAQTVADIRTRASSLTLLQEPPPALATTKTANCVSPEFPSRILVNADLTQDGQTLYENASSPVHGAILAIDATTGNVVSGSFILPQDPDRSDYPVIGFDEMRQRLAQGGQGGTPNGQVDINDAHFEWYQVTDVNEPVTTYLYPSLVGVGTITAADGTVSPYRIVVPLLKQ